MGDHRARQRLRRVRRDALDRRRDGDSYVLNGAKTFITNGPYADTIGVHLQARRRRRPLPRERQVLSFILDRGMPGLRADAAAAQDGPALVADRRAVPRATSRVGIDRLIGGDRRPGAPTRSSATRTGDARAAARGDVRIGAGQRRGDGPRDHRAVPRRLRRVRPHRVQFGTADRRVPADPGEVGGDGGRARSTFRTWCSATSRRYAPGKSLTFAEASAIKLYSARAATEVALEAVQVLGGNGYMAEFHVEQLARDAKVLQIYAGTDELQIMAIAKDLSSWPCSGRRP